MPGLFELATDIGTFVIPILTTIAVIACLYILFTFALSQLKKSLLRVAKTKKQISNVEFFTGTLRYIFLFFLILAAVFYYSGDWTALGLTLGLFSAAIGFALQRPISGIAAWIMVVTRRPFEIGDRIIIGGVKGDVRDINLTHVTLNEIGGMIQTEENSGRRIFIPNSILFEQNIVNYTHHDEFVLSQVVFSVTYESSLKRASEIALKAAKKYVGQFSETTKKEPYIRSSFEPSGIGMALRFFVPAKRITEISSQVTEEIHEMISGERDVSFAYPHTEIVLKQGSSAFQGSRGPQKGNQ